MPGPTARPADPPLAEPLDTTRKQYVAAEWAFLDAALQPFDGRVQASAAERLTAYNRYREVLRRLEALRESDQVQ